MAAGGDEGCDFNDTCGGVGSLNRAVGERIWRGEDSLCTSLSHGRALMQLAVKWAGRRYTPCS